MSSAPYGWNVKPFFYIGKWRIGVANFFTLLLILGLIGNMIFGDVFCLKKFSISSVDLPHEWWRILLYPFFSPDVIGKIFQIWITIVCGNELESRMGRQDFIILLLIPWLMVPAAELVAHVGTFSGASLIVRMLLLAYFSQRANSEFFIGIKGKWLAAIVILITLVPEISSRNWPSFFLQMITMMAVLAFLIWRHHIIVNLPRMMPHKKTSAPYVPKIRPQTTINLADDETDAILDKINAHGIQSLTEEEKQLLMKSSKQGKK